MIKTIILIAVLTLLSQWEVKQRMKRESASEEYTVLQHVVGFTVMMQWGAILSAITDHDYPFSTTILFSLLAIIAGIYSLYYGRVKGLQGEKTNILMILVVVILANLKCLVFD